MVDPDTEMTSGKAIVYKLCGTKGRGARGRDTEMMFMFSTKGRGARGRDTEMMFMFSVHFPDIVKILGQESNSTD